MVGNDLHGGQAKPDPTLAYRVALSAAMKLLFNADVENPMRAIAMIEAAQPLNEEEFGGMYDDVIRLAEAVELPIGTDLERTALRWTHKR